MRTGRRAAAVALAAPAILFVMSAPRPAAAQLLEMILEHAATTAAAHAAAEAAAHAAATAAAHAAVQGAAHAAVHGAAHAGVEAAAKAAAHGIRGARSDEVHDAHDRLHDPKLASRGNQDVNVDQPNDQSNPVVAERGPNRCNRAIGAWGFSNGVDVAVNPGGGLVATSFLQTVSGTWTCRASVVTMKWPGWTDHYAIAADGDNLSGVSGYGGGLSLTASRK
jgi:hypothetical protein